jgi:hypothetical protein
MHNEDVEILHDIDNENKAEAELKRKQQINKDFEKASQSQSFSVFNTIIQIVTTVVALGVCEYFLWTTNKILFGVVTALLILAFIFRHISKHYFAKGDQKKFETFNKLSKAAGTVSSVCDVTVLKKGKGAYTSDKVDSIESKVVSAVETIAEMQYKGGVYADAKYDSIRKRCIGMGKYIYQTQTLERINQLCNEVTKLRKSLRMSKDSNLKTSIFVMYIRDYINKVYTIKDEELFFAILGAVFHFQHPIQCISDSVPLVGYKDNSFCIYCVYADYREKIDNYKYWKVNTTKEALVEDTLTRDPEIWSILISNNQYESLARLIGSCAKEVRNSNNISVDIQEQIINYCELLHFYDRREFLDINEEQLDGITGLLNYIVCDNKDSLELTHMGLVDLPVFVNCCNTHCTDVLEKFKSWYALYKVYSENDVLTEYLDTVIGPDLEARENEIDRISKQYEGTDITNKEDQARIIISSMFKGENTIPHDLRSWAVSHNLMEEEAIDKIYSFIPEAYITDEDKKTQVIRYWMKYKHVIY